MAKLARLIQLPNFVQSAIIIRFNKITYLKKIKQVFKRYVIINNRNLEFQKVAEIFV